jgi:bacteriochlorophyll 4-vinyl reductase
MLAPINSPTTIRSIGLAPPKRPKEVCVGVPSCAPLVQHELLQAVRRQIPHAYERAGNELGLTVDFTQKFIEKRVDIVSAAGAIKLARMVAIEPNARDVFGETGRHLFKSVIENLPRAVKITIRKLPRPLRIRLALALTRKYAYQFAGGVNQIVVQERACGIRLSVWNGVFSDRLDTINCAQSYYRNIFETMLRELAFVDYHVREVKRPRFQLHVCSLEIVWEA